ncbi:S8 family peptidase [Microbispora sp. ATCC PTA-5024]|uniref:S8 family peptidase n=1 Tax=Microbispora sp. ATCC PTA-5024 TaxID=316330 RepID=UPI0003DC0841|nr:S8 family serine peptidase [Microbispora sp. ATCC PTA-5024]ETK37753.1 hypothetical protein MPTA5024_02135 [Microbispora sp. ATCC PTA-5024]
MTTPPVEARRTIRFAHTSVGAGVGRDAVSLPEPVTRAWAWGGATGRGVRVCVIDSGLDADHPLVGGRAETFRVEAAESGEETTWTVGPDDQGDSAGHGTACAGIIRGLAPDCELVSVRVLGKNLRGSGGALVAALEWAVRERFGVVNLSLSTQRPAFRDRLRELTDEAYFNGVTIVCAAHNRPVNSYPWRFPSVISVGSHAVPDPEYIEISPTPPVEFFANGVNVHAAWLNGGTTRLSGNSFATPNVAGLCARMLERHPGFRTPQLKSVLAAVAGNLI